MARAAAQEKVWALRWRGSGGSEEPQKRAASLFHPCPPRGRSCSALVQEGTCSKMLLSVQEE